MANKPLTNEDFDLESGFASNFDGTITEVIFGPNPSPQYRAKSAEPGLTLTIESPDLEEPVTAWYSLGVKKGWQVAENGASIVSSVNPNIKAFNMKSRAGEMIVKAITLVGDGDVTKGKAFFAKRGFYMTQAGMLLGLNFHWMNVVLPTQEEGRTSNSLQPDKYLGEVPVKGVAGAKIETPSVDTTALDDVVAKVASGKSESQVKVAMMKEKNPETGKTYYGDKANEAYFKELISGSKLAELEAAGTIGKGPDGKYV